MEDSLSEPDGRSAIECRPEFMDSQGCLTHAQNLVLMQYMQTTQYALSTDPCTPIHTKEKLSILLPSLCVRVLVGVLQDGRNKRK